jgi:hypothetical protein
MNTPDFEASVSRHQENPIELTDEPLTVRQATFIGGVLAPSLVYIGQVVDPVQPLTEVSSYSIEFALMGGVTVAGAVAAGIFSYGTQRFRQWRQRRSETALAERIEAVANPTYIEAGMEQFNALLDRHSSL